MAGMEIFIPLSIKSTTSSKWFDHSCSDAVENRDRAHRSWKQYLSEYFVVALDIFETFDRVWHASLL